MPASLIETSLEEFNEDVAVLVSFLAKLNQPLQYPPNISPAQLDDLIPQAALSAALALDDSQQYNKIKEATKAESKPALEEVRRGVQEKLKTLIRDPGVLRIVDERDSPDEESDEIDFEKLANAPSSLQAFPSFRVTENNDLVPTARIFIRHGDNVLADMTMDVFDLAFLAVGLISTAKDLTEMSKPYVGKQLYATKTFRRRLLRYLDDLIEESNAVREDVKAWSDQ